MNRILTRLKDENIIKRSGSKKEDFGKYYNFWHIRGAKEFT